MLLSLKANQSVICAERQHAGENRRGRSFRRALCYIDRMTRDQVKGDPQPGPVS